MGTAFVGWILTYSTVILAEKQGTRVNGHNDIHVWCAPVIDVGL